MGLLSAIVEGLLSPSASGDPNDERYWNDGLASVMSTTGLRVSPTEALQVSCIFQGTRLLSETIAALPIKFYREDESDAKQRDKKHPLNRTFRRRANVFQTAFQWRSMMTAHAILWNDGYSKIVPSATNPWEQLIPLVPQYVTVEQMSDYRIRVRYREPGKPEEILVQEQLFRLNGLSISKLAVSENVVLLAREAIGLWLAQEKFSALFFGQGARPSVWMEVPRKLSDEAFRRLKEQSQARLAGLRNMHSIALAEEGSKIKEVGFSAKDSQLNEARDSQVLEIARWMNIPEYHFRAGKSPTYASAYQSAQDFVDYSLVPHGVRWEQSIQRDLLEDEDLFAEHVYDGLLRGNPTERASAYHIYVTDGVMTRNEVRARENLPPLKGLDEPLTPLNMERTGAPPPADPEPAAPRRRPPVPAKGDAEDDARDTAAPNAIAIPRRLGLIVRGTASRVVRRELEEVRKQAQKLAARGADWEAAIGALYERHAGFVAEALELEPSVARAYAERHRAAVAAGGLAAAAEWETEAVRELTALALEQPEELHA